jgi:superfamily II DNA or RNA helicase
MLSRELEDCVNLYDRILKGVLSLEDVKKLDSTSENLYESRKRELNKTIDFIERVEKVDKGNIVTEVLFHQFISSYLAKNKDNISIDTFDAYLSGFDFKNEFHRCNFSKAKGDMFEYVSKYYFIWKGCEAYLFNEIPSDIREKLKLGTKDKGIDLIFGRGLKWYGVQCKWRSKTNECIDKNLIAGFIEELRRTKLDSGVVFTNVTQITNYFQDSKLKWVTSSALGKVFDNKFVKFMKNSQQKRVEKVEQPIKKLRDYQKKAIRALLDSEEKNNQCIMFCGTGKSIVMIEYIKRVNVDKVIVLMPSLQLISQFYKNLMINYPEQNVLCICSDMDANTLTYGEANDERGKAILKEFLNYDVDHLYTTDLAIIKKRLKADRVIVLCTYQSSSLLKHQKFNLGIFDEAHKTVNNEKFGLLLHDKKCVIKERIYFTATLKYYKGKEETCVSMANEKIYGKEVFNYPFSKAKNDGYVLDFRIIAYIVPKDMESIVTEKYIKMDKLNVDSRVLISAIQLAQHIQKTDECKKILTYHNSIKNAVDYKKTLAYIFYRFGIKASIFMMSGKTSMAIRNRIFDKFERSNIGIICSARVLNEGIDLPCVDTVSFVDSRSSTIDVTQCTGRGMRLYEDQKVCNIILPIHYNQLEGVHDYSHIIRILTAMNDIDSKLIEYFVTKEANNKIVIREMDEVNVEIIRKNKVKYELDDVVKGLDTAIISSKKLSFDYKMALLLRYSSKYKCSPNRSCVYKGHHLGHFLSNLMRKINNTSDEIYQQLKINKYIKEKVDEYLKNKEKNKDKVKLDWDAMYKLVCKYCDEHGHTPYQKCIFENQNIGSWYSTQKSDIRNVEDELYQKMKHNKYIKNNLEKYLDKREQKKDNVKLSWDEMYELVCEYSNINKHEPIQKCVFKNQNVGSWLSSQKAKINSTDDELYQKMKHNKYIKSNLDNYLENKELNKDKKKLNWNEMYKLACEYIAIHNTVPPQKCIFKGVKLGVWYTTQKSTINNIKDERYQYLKQNKHIKENLDEYLKRKEKNKDTTRLDWDSMYELVCEYCNLMKSAPVCKTIYKNHNLGNWISTQKRYINSSEDEMYQKMKNNKYIKKCLDEYLTKKNPLPVIEI